MPPQSKRDLTTRLSDGAVICAEGYLFELERRGYLQAGAYVPEVVLEFPEAVLELHREFLRAGSDVVEALTYYAHREKLRLIGKEDLLEPMQQRALELAVQAAQEHDGEPPLVAGNICNTNVYNPDDSSTDKTVSGMFEEQIGWAVDAGVDYIIAETIGYCGEAELALSAIKAAGLPAVVTFAAHDAENLRDGIAIVDAAKQLHDAGAAVVGLNCTRGPRTMLPIVQQMRSQVDGHLGALPVPYRTTPSQPIFQALDDPGCDSIPEDRPFPTALDPFTCNRYEIAEFTRRAIESNIRYLGVCCGAAPHHVRAMAEAIGRTTPASKFSPDMSKHYSLGTDNTLKDENVGFVDGLRSRADRDS
jgi:betaine-homocysteine S-methyltransferase